MSSLSTPCKTLLSFVILPLTFSGIILTSTFILECNMKVFSLSTCNANINNVTMVEETLQLVQSNYEEIITVKLLHTYECLVINEYSVDAKYYYHLYGDYTSYMSLDDAVVYVNDFNTSIDTYKLPYIKAYYKIWDVPDTPLLINARDSCSTVIEYLSQEYVSIVLGMNYLLICLIFNFEICFGAISTCLKNQMKNKMTIKATGMCQDVKF